MADDLSHEAAQALKACVLEFVRKGGFIAEGERTPWDVFTKATLEAASGWNNRQPRPPQPMDMTTVNIDLAAAQKNRMGYEVLKAYLDLSPKDQTALATLCGLDVDPVPEKETKFERSRRRMIRAKTNGTEMLVLKSVEELIKPKIV